MARKLVTTLVIAALSTAAFGSVAVAQGDVIAQRKAILKNFGAVNRPVNNMMQGKADFELAKVHAALDTFAKDSARLPALFPPGSDKGDTDTLPAAWANKADFNGKFAKFAADSRAAKALIKDEASFKANWPKVAANCGGCHKPYRAP